MKTFVIGDLHGNYKALIQCLERSKFDRNIDRLICLGDIVDGFPDTKACVETLRTLNIHLLIGNHDVWALNYWKGAPAEVLWLKQGGQATIDSYGGEKPPKEHLNFFDAAWPFIEWKNTLFVHGGFNHQTSIEGQDLDDLCWDRQMVETAWKKTIRNQPYKFGPYEDIFVGHTSTQCFGVWDGTHIIERRTVKPLQLCNIWMIDTGAGWDGKLTIMNVETKEYWQSDLALQLYPGMGRGLRFND